MAPPKTTPASHSVRLNLNLPTFLIEQLDEAVEVARRNPRTWPRPTRTRLICEAILAWSEARPRPADHVVAPAKPTSAT
jgi:hypothetical protein